MSGPCSLCMGLDCTSIGTAQTCRPLSICQACSRQSSGFWAHICPFPIQVPFSRHQRVHIVRCRRSTRTWCYPDTGNGPRGVAGGCAGAGAGAEGRATADLAARVTEPPLLDEEVVPAAVALQLGFGHWGRRLTRKALAPELAGGKPYSLWLGSAR